MGRVAAGAISLVENERQAEDIAVLDPGKLAYLTQTTLSLDDTAQIVAILKRRFPQIVGSNTADICYATTNRQDAVKAIAPQADAILVIGAPNSSNSNRLVEVAQVQGCAHAQLIQRATDIDWQAISGAGTVGITAGASAPEILVQEVLEALGERFELNLENVTVTEEDVTFSMPKALLG
jgi:4-hydroxy-3-methylbut-2-enyl diphosphate reductase